jgi:hypothetical protein
LARMLALALLMAPTASRELEVRLKALPGLALLKVLTALQVLVARQTVPMVQIPGLALLTVLMALQVLVARQTVSMGQMPGFELLMASQVLEVLRKGPMEQMLVLALSKVLRVKQALEA